MGASTHASKRDISIEESRASGRSKILNTDIGLHTGPEPGRIDRELYANNAGYIGARQSIDAAHPDAGDAFLPHIPLNRPAGNVTPFLRTIDVSVQVPAIYVANPTE